ncbi:MAG: protein translocase subunit SecF [Alphaproteobacteria bacterium]
MQVLKFITKDTNINFLKISKVMYIFSIVSVIASLVVMTIKPFNYGIDFSGGILIEIKSPQQINLNEIRKSLTTLKIGEISLQTIGDAGDEVMIRAQAKNMDEKQQMQAVEDIKSIIGQDVEYRKVELVGPQVGSELKKAGLIASIVAVLAISLYIWFRFEWQFALGAMLGLVHDILVTLALLAIFNIDFNLTTIAAILTLAGYSVNDTVVTYDRIRENLRKFGKMKQNDMLNKSINDIFSRTLLTSITTLLAAVALLIFGGDALYSFSFVIVWGVLIGTYSSIYVSVAILNQFDLSKTTEEKELSTFERV